MAFNSSTFTLLTFLIVGTFAQPHGPKGHNHPVPQFLKKLSEVQRKEFLEIENNKTLTIAEIEDEQEAFAKENGVLADYKAFEANITAHHEAIQQNITNIIGNLANVHSKLSSIFENKDQTHEQRHEAIEKVKEGNEEEVDALVAIFESLARPHRRAKRGVVIGDDPNAEDDDDDDDDDDDRVNPILIGTGPETVESDENIDDDEDEDEDESKE